MHDQQCVVNYWPYFTVTHTQRGVGLSSLVAVMHSADWIAYSTAEDKIYFVNTQTQGLQSTVCKFYA